MGDGEWLVEVLAAELTAGSHAWVRRVAGLADLVDEHLAAGAAAWPAIAIAPEAYVRHLAGALPEDPPADPTQFMRGLHAADLYLACACAHGDPGALAALERQYLSQLDGALRATGVAASQVDEIRQRVREALLVGEEDRPPGIARYGGRAQLRSWLRSVAVRQAMRSFRDDASRPRQDDDGLDALPALAGDAELALWRSRYAGDFRGALEEAIAGLDKRDRTLLRQHYLDGLSIDRLALLHRVHRATAARWVVAARTQLFEATRRGLGARLGVGPDEIDSIVRLVRSQIDMSLHRILR